MEKVNKNLKLYPKYRQLSMDFLFFYTINILFLTQIKKIDMSAVVLVDTFYALFVVFLQVPASYLVGKIGIKKSMILGNTCNTIYLIVVINSTNLFNLIIAELFSSFGFALKDISEPAILNESINATKSEKSKIFAKTQGKAVSGYYIISAFSMILSGFLFEINGYIPIFISLGIVITTLIISTRFDNVEINEKDEEENIVSLKEAVKFSFNSKRTRCLLIFSSIVYSVITVLATYEVSLLEDMNVSSKYIGIVFAILNIVSGIASKNQNLFQEKFKNRTLTFLGISLTLSCIISGLVASLNLSIQIILTIVLAMYVIKFIMVGLYNVFLIKYLSNFTNSKIDTRIFAINNFCSCILGVVFGIFASILIENMKTSSAMLIFGGTSLIIISIVLIYMRNKVGLDPKEYSEIELKYDVKDWNIL